MLLFMGQLVHELSRSLHIHSYNITPDLVINGIEPLPLTPTGVFPEVDMNTAYICEYQALTYYNPGVAMPPLFCIVDHDANVQEVFLKNRAVALVTGCTVMDFMTALHLALYICASQTSPMTEISHQLVRCRTLQELVDQSSELLGCPVIVTDRTQKIAAATPREKVASPVYRDILLAEYLPVSRPSAQHLGDASLDGPRLDVSLPDLSVVCKTLRLGKVLQGHLHIIRFTPHTRPEDAYLIELIGNLAAGLLHYNGLQHPEQVSETDEFFRDLLSNGIGGDEEILERQREVGLRLKQHLTVVILTAAQVDYTPRISFYDLARECSRIMNCRGIFIDNTVLLLLDHDAEITDFQAELAPLQPYLTDYNLIAGVSRSFAQLPQLNRYAHQARVSLRFGTVLDRGKRIFEYGDYAAYHMIEIALGGNDLEMFCAPELIRLVKYEQENGGDLVSTLQAYLDCGCNKAETARQLFLHINTFKYRLAKIEEIFGHPIENGESAFMLSLSLKMLKYRDSFPAPITLEK